MDNLKKVSDVIPLGIFSEYERTEIDEVLDKDIIINEFEILLGNYGEFAVILFNYPNEEVMKTFPCGGLVVLKKLNKIKENNSLPILGKIVKQTGKRQTYYDLI